MYGGFSSKRSCLMFYVPGFICSASHNPGGIDDDFGIKQLGWTLQTLGFAPHSCAVHPRYLYIIILPGFKMIYHKMNQAIQNYNALSFFSRFFFRGTTAKMEARHLRSWRTRCWNGPPRSRSWKAAAPRRSVKTVVDGRTSSNLLAKDGLYWQK